MICAVASSALSALSGDLQRAGREQDVLDALLARPLTLPAVRGTALYLLDGSGGRFVRGAGVCACWPDGALPSPAAAVLSAAVETGRPQLLRSGPEPTETPAAPIPTPRVLPILRGERVVAALVLVGQARDPFTALDDKFLLALGQQVGRRAGERRSLQPAGGPHRGAGPLSARMVEQHEEERRRLSRELHDETAQVFSAVKMELGVLRERSQPAQAGRLDQCWRLIDTGIRSIRNVTNDLRPSLLDDLGLLPALRSLVADFAERSGIAPSSPRRPSCPPVQRGRAGAVPRAAGGALQCAAARRCPVGGYRHLRRPRGSAAAE